MTIIFAHIIKVVTYMNLLNNFEDLKLGKYIEHVEGGYCNEPHDPGGETKYGISKASFPHLDIKNITFEQAMKIYKSNYWFEARCNVVPFPINMILFDAAVLQGTVTAQKILQRAIRIMGKPIQIDGKIGSETIKALSELDLDSLSTIFLELRMQMLANTSTWKYYGNVWTDRLSHLVLHIKELKANK